MSTADDSGQSDPADAARKLPADIPAETDGQEAEENAGGFIVLFFMIGLFASLILGWVVFPKLLYSKKIQPVSFNHALHLDHVDDDCESCHFFREDGSYAGVPANDQCIECHEDLQGVEPGELLYVSEYLEQDREVPWLIYSRQPDCVFFSHAAHVKTGKMECEQCHGSYRESTSLKPYYENRFTGYSRDIWGKSIAGIKQNAWDRMKMDDCDDCHRKEGIEATSVQTGKDACFVCHK